MNIKELKNMGIINHLESLDRDDERFESYEVDNEKFCIVLKHNTNMFNKDGKIYGSYTVNYVVEYIEEIYVNDIFDRYNFIIGMYKVLEFETKDMNDIHIYKKIEESK